MSTVEAYSVTDISLSVLYIFMYLFLIRALCSRHYYFSILQIRQMKHGKLDNLAQITKLIKTQLEFREGRSLWGPGS